MAKPTELRADEVTEIEIMVPIKVQMMYFKTTGEYIGRAKGIRGVISFGDSFEQCKQQMPDAVQTMLHCLEEEYQKEEAQ